MRTDRLFPKLWLPGGWGGQYGAYQSQLKAIMKMIGQPGGEVRRPRLPVTDEASLAAIRSGADRGVDPARDGRGGLMFRGVDHIGVGVGDMDVAIEFYGRVGFSDVLFDYTGAVPGTEAFTSGAPRQARIAMLGNPSATPIGPGRIKLVQVLDGDGPPPIPEGTGWGELGICEICLHVRDLEAVHERLAALPGGGTLMAPLSGAVVPYDVSLDISYVHDPWGGKIEMIEWTGLWKSLPGEPRAEGVNHVAFGVADMDASLAFYRRLGFDEMLFESTDFFDPMAPWYDRELPGPAHGDDDVDAGRRHRADPPDAARARLPRRVGPPRPDGVRGRGLEPRARLRRSSRPTASTFRGPIQTVDVGTGEWRYRYLVDPDGLYVSLVEGRY